jgi:hypothetical protein
MASTSTDAPRISQSFAAVSQWFIDHGLPIQTRLWTRGFAWTIILCVLFNISSAAYLLILQPRVQWISAFGPWKQLASIVEQYEDLLSQRRA